MKTTLTTRGRISSQEQERHMYKLNCAGDIKYFTHKHNKKVKTKPSRVPMLCCTKFEIKTLSLWLITPWIIIISQIFSIKRVRFLQVCLQFFGMMLLTLRCCCSRCFLAPFFDVMSRRDTCWAVSNIQTEDVGNFTEGLMPSINMRLCYRHAPAVSNLRRRGLRPHWCANHCYPIVWHKANMYYNTRYIRYIN